MSVVALDKTFSIWQHGYPNALINPCLSHPQIEAIYQALQENKWKEAVDSCYHNFGKKVFDQGLHGGEVEKGYWKSIKKAFEFVSCSLNRKVNIEWYLELHRLATAHF